MKTAHSEKPKRCQPVSNVTATKTNMISITLDGGT